jgi:hypothetical protein
MPDENVQSTELRHFSRILFNAPATLLVEQIKHPCEVLDLSLRGALLRTPMTLPVGVQAELALTLGSDEARIVMTGEVAHIKQDHIGLRFAFRSTWTASPTCADYSSSILKIRRCSSANCLP